MYHITIQNKIVMENKNYSLPEIQIKFKSGEFTRYKIKDSKTCEQAFRTMFDADTIEYTESVIVIFLNRSNETIGWYKVSQGGLTHCVVDQRVIFSIGVQCGASAFIVAHNHPSGNLVPSNEDLGITRKLIEGGKILDILCLDHLILSGDSYISMADESLLIF